VSVDLLRVAIKASGLSPARFAREVVVRDPRTIRRWLRGKPIPETVIHRLKELTRKEADHA